MIHERFKQLMEIFNHNPYSFSEEIGVSSTVIYNIIGGRRSNPGFELLEKIKERYPEVDLNWLVSGIGSPLLDNDKMPEINFKIHELSKQLERLAGVRDQYISVLKAKINSLEKKNDSKKKVFTQAPSAKKKR